MKRKISEATFQQFVVEQLRKLLNQVGAVQDDVAAMRTGQRALRKSVENVADDQRELRSEIDLVRDEIAEIKEELRPAH